MPLIAADTVQVLIDAAQHSSASIVRVTFNGRHGHPVIFKRETFAALRAADRTVGAKAVFQEFVVEDVSVADPGVIEDVDTPADFARLVDREPPTS
jgi:molybdenum cofactor cytidylyltransferase